MTDRLYYTDAWCTRFSATVVAVEADGHHVILDRTAFYPTSGGQPHDLGTLGPDVLVDVIDEESRIVHVCAAPTTLTVGATVDGVIDATRRFDHMQQHSGQHLLSAFLADRYGWPTVSVHFGAVTNTVDVAASEVAPQLLATIEADVNRLAAEHRAITVHFEDAATVTGLRKPSDRDGLLRIVTIDGIDKSACGGTHVDGTGSIGAIQLRRTERTKGNTRIEFVCGLRAVARARHDAALLTASARQFTAAPDELPTLIATQAERVKALESALQEVREQLAVHDARRWWDATVPDAAGVRHVVHTEFSGPVRDAEPLVRALTAMGACTVLVSSPSTRGVLVGASASSGVHAGTVLRTALQAVGGRGGGSPTLAQGVVPDGAPLADVVSTLVTSLSGATP